MLRVLPSLPSDNKANDTGLSVGENIVSTSVGKNIVSTSVGKNIVSIVSTHAAITKNLPETCKIPVMTLADMLNTVASDPKQVEIKQAGENIANLKVNIATTMPPLETEVVLPTVDDEDLIFPLDENSFRVGAKIQELAKARQKSQIENFQKNNGCYSYDIGCVTVFTVDLHLRDSGKIQRRAYVSVSGKPNPFPYSVTARKQKEMREMMIGLSEYFKARGQDVSFALYPAKHKKFDIIVKALSGRVQYDEDSSEDESEYKTCKNDTSEEMKSCSEVAALISLLEKIKSRRYKKVVIVGSVNVPVECVYRIGQFSTSIILSQQEKRKKKYNYNSSKLVAFQKGNKLQDVHCSVWSCCNTCKKLKPSLLKALVSQGKKRLKHDKSKVDKGCSPAISLADKESEYYKRFDGLIKQRSQQEQELQFLEKNEIATVLNVSQDGSKLDSTTEDGQLPVNCPSTNASKTDDSQTNLINTAFGKVLW